MQVEELHREVLRRLEELVKREPGTAKRLAWFRQQHKTPGVTSHGLSTPAVRKLIRGFRNDFRQLRLEDRFSLAALLYNSGNFEQATIADTLVELSLPALTPGQFDLLDRVVGRFSNWASVDWLCLHGFQRLLLEHRQETLDLLRKWNRSDNLWKRRASVVAFVREIGSSGDFTTEALELCDNLIRDSEEMVQKGVGWALKDSLPGDRARVLDYIKELRRKGVPSTITLYAIRDLKGKEREEIIAVKAK
jgi:3-methyladenine DNA glycosylase AlkD